MSSQRPFFGNFLAAFRAHSAMQKAAASTQQSTQQASRTYTTTTSASTSSSSQASSSMRTTTKTGQPAPTTTASTAAAASAFHSSNRQQHASTSPYSRSPASPASPGTTSGFMNRGSSKRRGSDSSTEGFRDVLGEQKWYIGGRTAAGEERFYKLGVVKRVKSIDRLSLDRMSL